MKNGLNTLFDAIMIASDFQNDVNKNIFRNTEDDRSTYWLVVENGAKLCGYSSPIECIRDRYDKWVWSKKRY